ncbi:hypothetical protein GE061_006500 [Apolygus lucorum]|uniref:Uncharacterized protein n=1 Tax=Apolygus lucorum TaxID=248454 RepID=A0A6A4J0U0_APOLU|nr:hypothetical protein GE061_006500 [Apolygus lucorum]
MKPRSFLTLRKPTGANGIRGRNLKIQLLDTDSPEIRRSVERCLTTLNTRYRSTWRTTSIKKMSINRTQRRKSEIRMAARRKQHRIEYLDLKRVGNEPQYIHEVPTPSTSTVESESLSVEGASSLESVQRLVTERKEYLEMSQSRKQKFQWYQRVARQSDQLLNFLRANDRSSGDSVVKADLVLVSPPAAEPTRDAPLAQLQPVNSTVISVQPETTPKPVKTTLKRRMQKSTIKDLNKPKHHKSDRLPPAGPSNVGKSQGKQNIRMAEPSGNDSLEQQESTNRGTPSSPAGRVMKKIQDARIALNTHISASQQMKSDAASNKGKTLGNLLGDDKENQAIGRILSDDSMMCLRATPGAVNNGLRKYGFYMNSDSRKVNHSNPNGVSSSGNFIKNGDMSSPTRNISGVPANRTWSTTKRKRVNFNGSWSNIMKSEAEGSSKVGAMEDKFASMAEVRAHRPEDSIWWNIRKMWKKNEKGSEMKQEDSEESLSRRSSVEDDLPKGGGFNPYKMLSRARIGRTVKRRRRDPKSPQVVQYEEDEADYPPGLMDFQGVGQPSGRCFVIPDQPYEVEEALSMDLMQTAFDFIHNG